MATGLLIQQIPESDEAQFSELMDRSFSVPKGQSYLSDFPVWRGRTPEIMKMGAYDGEKLVAAAGVRVADLWTRGSRQILTGLIGAVATNEKYRGQGIAKSLVLLASDWAQNRGAAIVVLWGSEHELYSKVGFYPCGEQVRIMLSSLKSPVQTKVQEGWNPALFPILQHRKSGIALREIDRLWLTEQKNVKWFWSGPREKPTAYGALGRGIDLHHIVHEWGGALKDLLSVLSAISEIDPAAELLGSPSVFSRAKIQYDPASVEYLCLAKILDEGVLLRSFCDTPLAKTDLEAIAPEQLPRFLFGPREASLIQGNAFPLPLWFWGLDAV